LSISAPALREWIAGLGSALLPQVCVLCHAASGDELLCRACASELPIAAAGCPRCAATSGGSSLCGACLSDPPFYDATHAAFDYRFPVDALIQALKYGGQLTLASLFAQALRERIGASAGVNLIVPLPLHPRRLAERGFNQAAEIAKPLARKLAKSLDVRLGQRIRDTAAQTGLPWRGRTSNVRHAFTCERSLGGLNIAVVDDVMTTGATLNEFARALKDAGAGRVENWVVARTTRDV